MKHDIILKTSITSVKDEDVMKTPDFVDQILDLTAKGWGKRKIARELGTTVKTVKKYLRQGKWVPYSRKVSHRLGGHWEWLKQAFLQHRGNAAVVHQELLKQKNISVHIRTVQRAVKPLRQLLRAQEKATVRFETPPGKQLQIDFGSIKLMIGGEQKKAHFFVATLGYSRRNYVQVFTHERQIAWLDGLDGAFRHFGGIPNEILLDNAKALVTYHNPLTREVVFNDRIHAFASYWGTRLKACAPYRARTKGKDESGVKYVKRNCIAGREFASWASLEKHLQWWMREVADVRIHGTTGEKPIDRFKRDEASALKDLVGKPPFCQVRELQRVVHSDSCIEFDTNHYSVPWRYIKEKVTIQVISNEVIVMHGGNEIARHPLSSRQREWIRNNEHLEGIVGKAAPKNVPFVKETPLTSGEPLYELLRPLEEYEAIVGGGW